MPDSMIERVARAMCAEVESMVEVDYAELGVGSAASFVDKFWPNYASQARVAIEAMREPTETMKAANDEVHWGYSCAQCGGLTEGWYAMMDAALEGEK